jgi:phage recombination protein Bet
MTNALAQINNSLTMWEDSKQIEEIRKLFAPKLTDTEFQYFLGLGRATGLNPFLREIWSVKYDDRAPASVFIGRDGYRKAAHSDPDYDYHQVDAVYENDTFEVNDGIIKHSYKLTNRGALIRAYCIVKKRNSSRPIYTSVSLAEYATGQSTWRQKPETMIKKVAESQGLRAAFHEKLGGTYCEEEMSHNQADNNNLRVIHGGTQTETLKNILNNTTIDAEVVNTETGEVTTVTKEHAIAADNEPISQENIDKIEIIMDEMKFDDIRRERFLEHFKVKKLSDLTQAQAKIFFVQMRVTHEN